MEGPGEESSMAVVLSDSYLYRLSASDTKKGDYGRGPQGSAPVPPPSSFYFLLIVLVLGFIAVLFVYRNSVSSVFPTATVPYCLLSLALIYAWRFGPRVPRQLQPESRPLLVLCIGVKELLGSVGLAIIEMSKPRKP